MKLLTLLLLCITLQHTLYCQYYLRGIVQDEKGKPLFGAKIYLQTKGQLLFNSGDDGSFGLPTPKAIDTITVLMQGYEPCKMGVNTQQFQTITLKMMNNSSQMMLNRLNSLTTNLGLHKDLVTLTDMGDSYNNLIENDFVNAATHPETGFAINTDRASYSNIRRFVANQMKPPTSSVRIEQMLNYFNLHPSNSINTSETKFSFHPAVSSCPWNKNNNLVYINLQAPKLNLKNIPPCNLVFLIDVSGSMDQPNRLPLLQSAFKMLVDNLRDVDRIAIVTYGGGVNVVLNPTSGGEKKKILDVINGLNADGDTPGSGAIRTAYYLAKEIFKKEANNRVIIATDGDFNVGQHSDQELEDIIVSQKQTGIFLTCLGVGMGNFKDSKLQTLAKFGNGNYAYLDNIVEAEKVLVTEFTQTLFNVAEDAYLKINFNPKLVHKYRLIGFDNTIEAVSTPTNQLEGGEVGSGHNLMAIFEVEPNNNLTNSTNLAQLHLQYIVPKTKQKIIDSFAIANEFKDIMAVDSVYRFATAVTMYGSLMIGSKYERNFSFDDVMNLAKTAADARILAQKEFLQLIDKAIEVYYPGKKKRK